MLIYDTENKKFWNQSETAASESKTEIKEGEAT